MTFVNEMHCPLCGTLNHCSMAARPSQHREQTVPCWCSALDVPNELLEKIPPEARMKACICKHCIENFNAQQSSP